MKKYFVLSFLFVSAGLMCSDGFDTRNDGWSAAGSVVRNAPFFSIINSSSEPVTVTEPVTGTAGGTGGKSYTIPSNTKGASLIPKLNGITIVNSGNKIVHLYLNYSSGSNRQDLIHVIDRNLNPGESVSIDKNQKIISIITITDAS